MEELDTGQKLYRLQNSQNKDGTVNLEISEWSEEDNKIHFIFTDPLGDETRVMCAMPRSTEEDNFFNDILEYTGWEYSTAEENLEEEKIPAMPVEDGYDILPENVTWWDKLKDIMKDDGNNSNGSELSTTMLILCFPLAWFMGLTMYGDIVDEGRGFIIGGFAALLWVSVILFFIL